MSTSWWAYQKIKIIVSNKKTKENDSQRGFVNRKGANDNLTKNQLEPEKLNS